MQKFNKAPAPSAAKPSLGKQEESARARMKERKVVMGGRAEGPGLALAFLAKALVARSCPTSCCQGQEVSVVFG